MAAGLWKITELTGTNAGETFVWSADTTPPTPNGGGRAAPKAPWTFGGTLRHVRTDYPGSTTPSYQVLGPAMKQFTLEGAFDDRYNFAGYAKAEMRRFEDMCKRGNPCVVQFQDQAFVGLFVDWDFPYRRDWQIGYTLTFDVAERADSASRKDRATDLEAAPVQLFDAVDLAVQSALDFNDKAPRAHLSGDTMAGVEASLASMASSVDQLGLSIDNRDITPPENPVDGFTRMASQFREVQGSAYNLLVQLGSVRSDVELAVQTAMGVLDFEDWSRSLRFAARIAMGRSVAGDRACGARAEPDAVRLYRPQRGESLYAISRKFYGTPFAWRLIFDRNHLTSVTLTGDETLVIPERGA